MDSKSLNIFQSVSTKDHSCEIYLKLAEWLRRKCYVKKLWANGWSDGQ